MSSGWDKLDCFVLLARLAGRRCPPRPTSGSFVPVVCGQGHGWLWGPYRSPAGHWPQNWHRTKGSWHRDGSILAPVEARVETGGGSFREGRGGGGGIKRLMLQYTWRPAGGAVSEPRRWMRVSQQVSCVTNARRRPRPSGEGKGKGRGYCPGTYGQLMELPESCMSRISVSMGVFPTRRMKKSCEMRLAGTARRAGRRSSRRPKRCGWLGYCILSYSVRATWAFSCRDSTWTGSVRPQASAREAGSGYSTAPAWAAYVKSRDERRGGLKSRQLACCRGNPRGLHGYGAE